jgi:hypothetical protein
MWRIDVAIESALLLLLIGRRVHARWPGLVAFLACVVARDIILLYADWHGAKALYCWAYYIGSAVADAAEVLLITEISLELVGPFETLRGIVARNVPMMTVMFILGSTLASLPGHHQEGIPHLAALVYYCRRLDLAASLGCSAGLIMLIGIAVSLKIQFSHGVRPIAIGMLVEVSFTYMQAVNMMDGWVAQTTFPRIRSLAYFVSLLCFSAPAIPHKRRGRSFFSSSTSAPFQKSGVRANA